MDDVRDAWREVAGKVESLGLKLKLHLEQEHDAGPSDDTPTGDDAAGDEAEVAEASGAGSEIEEALDRLGGQLSDAFDAFGNAARDDAVRADVREIGDLLRDALSDTLRAVGTEVSGLASQVADAAAGAASAATSMAGVSNRAEDGDQSADAADADTDTDGAGNGGEAGVDQG